MPRLHSRHALAVAIGTSIAGGYQHVPAALFDGICESEEEAKEMAFRVNVKRDEAKFKAMAKNGLPGILGAT
jgi:hypothetical protein